MTPNEFPNAEIIAVGSELLTPSRMDTNSLYLTEKLNTLGVEVVRKSIVGDDRERLASVISAALGTAFVFVTGGLGPTEDDVTRDAAAAALGRPLVFETTIVEWLERRFASFGRKMAEINKRQAYLIEGAEALPNPNGTAPGQWVERDGTAMVLLPGPPGELKPMFENECLPRLESRLPKQCIRTLIYRVAGMGESDLDALIAPVYTKYSNPITTILAAAGDVQVHLRARCATREEADAVLAEVGPQIEALLGARIYSRRGEPLEVEVGQLLRSRGETVTVAESCTGGMLAGRITSVAGSSDYFSGGFITYSDAMKVAMLGVPAELVAEHSAVSEAVAKAMAEGARARTGATYALSVTGIAGPGGGTDATPAGTVFIGLASTGGIQARRVRFPGGRERIRVIAVQTALDMLRRVLEGYPATEALAVR
jgi:nicotinamide-nucleotide amidase